MVSRAAAAGAPAWISRHRDEAEGALGDPEQPGKLLEGAAVVRGKEQLLQEPLPLLRLLLAVHNVFGDLLRHVDQLDVPGHLEEREAGRVGQLDQRRGDFGDVAFPGEHDHAGQPLGDRFTHEGEQALLPAVETRARNEDQLPAVQPLGDGRGGADERPGDLPVEPLFTGDQPDLPEVPEALEVRAGDGHGAPSFQNSAGGKRKKT